MLLGLLALALVDSINPSAIVVALYLLSRERVPAQVVVYVAAIFLTYSTGDSRLGFIVRGVIGLGMLLWARSGRRRQPSHRRESSRPRARMPRWPSLALP